MKSVLLLISSLLLGATGGFHTNSTGVSSPGDAEESVGVKLDVSRLIRRVDPRFLSVTIDANLARHEKFMFLLSSPKIRTLSRALNPAFLRFGGTRQDFMVFTPQFSSTLTADKYCDELELPSWLGEKLEEWNQQEMLLMREDQKRMYNQTTYTESTVDLLNSFANCTGLDLIFGLNALLRTPDNTWNSSNALLLMQYCESRQYRMSWELGNEPNSFRWKSGIYVDGSQLGQDFTHLRQIMSKSKFYHDAQLYGPDIGQPKPHHKSLLESFLQSGADAIDAFTWHHYYVNGRDTSLKDFLDPKVLDMLETKTNEVLERVNLVSPGKSVWLGETSSAYGGGADRLSNTFVAGFMWLDKLGLAARLGINVVMRQALVGSGRYNLVDIDLEPLPDYWLSVLYKRLVGPEVLSIKAFSISSQSTTVRLYLHCTNGRSYGDGAVTMISLNLRKMPARLSMPSHVSSSTVEAFVLQSEKPGKEGLHSRSVKLNGQVLKMVDDKTLPDLKGIRLPAAEHLELPGYSLAFYVLRDARAAACRTSH